MVTNAISTDPANVGMLYAVKDDNTPCIASPLYVSPFPSLTDMRAVHLLIYNSITLHSVHIYILNFLGAICNVDKQTPLRLSFYLSLVFSPYTGSFNSSVKGQVISHGNVKMSSLAVMTGT